MKPEDFAVNLADSIKIEHPIMNAAGTCRTLEEVEELARSASSVIVVGSITYQAQEGKSGETYWSEPDYSINNKGLPNLGITYYQENLPQMIGISHEAGKPLFLSLAPQPEGIDTLLTLIRQLPHAKPDLIELNLSCPHRGPRTNLAPKNEPRIPCFYPEFLEWLMETILDDPRCCLDNIKHAVKLAPFSNPQDLEDMAKVLKDYSWWINVITTTNTLANALIFDEKGKPRLSPDSGLGGLAGPALKPIGLGQVFQWRQLLPKNIDIIGVGGISSGKDVLDYLRAGAKVVQVATAFLNEGIRVFDRLLSEFVDEVEKGEKP